MLLLETAGEDCWGDISRTENHDICISDLHPVFWTGINACIYLKVCKILPGSLETTRKNKYSPENLFLQRKKKNKNMEQ